MNDEISYPLSVAREPEMVGRSAVISQLRETLDRLADTDLSTLITGETGAGKEVAARHFHRARQRRERQAGSFMVLESLLSSPPADLRSSSPELDLPRACTLFIDEIAELSPQAQAWLLYALSAEHGSSLRVVAATRHPLVELRDPSRLRPDLFYWLSEYVVEVPPLRHHTEDIRALAESFLSELRTKQELTRQAYRDLEACAWPGNVRELRAVIRRAALMHPEQSELGPEELFEHASPPSCSDSSLCHLLDRSWESAKEEFGRWYWTNVWRQLAADRQKVVEHTQVSKVWLRNRIKLYELHSQL